MWCDVVAVQVFAYLLLSANAAGTTMARTLKEMDTCRASNAFCVQMDIAIALGYAAFVFLGLTSLLTGFRVVCFIINGSRFHLWVWFCVGTTQRKPAINEYFGWGRVFFSLFSKTQSPLYQNYLLKVSNSSTRASFAGTVYRPIFFFFPYISFYFIICIFIIFNKS